MRISAKQYRIRCFPVGRCVAVAAWVGLGAWSATTRGDAPPGGTTSSSASAASMPASRPARLPSAKSIIDDYLKITGGREARRKHRNCYMRGKTIVKMADGKEVNGSFEQWQAAPDKSYFVMHSADGGDYDQGYNGTEAWEISPAGGPKLFEGEEKISTARRSALNYELDFERAFKKLACVDLMTGKEGSAYKVEMTPPEGSVETRYFDVKSKLLLQEEMHKQAGRTPYTLAIQYGDYREIDGLIIPHQMIQISPWGVQFFQIEDVQYNIEMPKDRFDLPDVIQVLVTRRASSQPAPASAPK